VSIIKTNKFNVGSVYVSDLHASLKFYIDILGFRIKEEMSPGYLLTIEDGFLLYLEGGMKPKASTDNTSPCVSLCFDAEGGIKNAYEKLKEKNIKLIGDYMKYSDNFHMFRIADPDGNILEFAGKP
jgi:predicted enzyme related to lactoylglutathione lyase